MKKYLFIDNYRGFSKTTIPLVDVNFMVGENSTGKTSVLSLLRILSTSSLFMGPNFGGGEEVQFGHFNEVVSAHATDRSYFRIGFVEQRSHPNKKGEQLISAMLLTYKDASGIPKLSRMTSSSGGHEISLRIVGDKVWYHTKSPTKKSLPTAEDMKLSLQQWGEDHAGEGSEWNDLETPKGAGAGEVPLYILLHFAMEKSKSQAAFPLIFGGFNEPLIWIAPIRTKPRRTYDEPNTSFSSEGSHTPYVIRRMLNGPEASKFKKFMDQVGKASGLFQSIEIKKFGKSDDAPFEVDAVLDNKALNLSWLGYGVSQSLPIFVELLDRPKGSSFAIQQPEVHLHPRAQASLGDVFYEMALLDRKRFVIETHSDFTIDRFRMNYRRKKSKRNKDNGPRSQILFFERRDSLNTVTALPIGTRGELPADQPQSYREFFVNEEIELLDV